jgi:hypothetical protein
MSNTNCIPPTASASLEAGCSQRAALEDLDVEVSRAVTPARARRSRLVNDLKLLFAALGAGGSAVPLGDNGHTARLLSNYAASLQDH